MLEAATWRWLAISLRDVRHELGSPGHDGGEARTENCLLCCRHLGADALETLPPVSVAETSEKRAGAACLESQSPPLSSGPSVIAARKQRGFGEWVIPGVLPFRCAPPYGQA